MKRAGRLLERIVERDNLRLAVHRALQGKRDRADAREFTSQLDGHLREMADLVWSGEFPVGRCSQFTIYDPRYMDDSVIWGDTSADLRGVLARCEGFLDADLQLAVKATPVIGPTRHGFEFLGCRVYRDHLKLNRRSRARFRCKLFELETAFARGELDEQTLQQRVTALVAFTTAGGTRSWKLRTRVLQRMAVSGPRARTG